MCARARVRACVRVNELMLPNPPPPHPPPHTLPPRVQGGVDGAPNHGAHPALGGGSNHGGPGDKSYAFVEFRTVEEASNAMALDGVNFRDCYLKVSVRG